MKRSLLLVVCVVAAFGAVPASAECPPVNVDGGYLCAGGADEYGPFEFCVDSWTGNTVRSDLAMCADTNNDAWSDAYVDEYGQLHHISAYLYDDYLQVYASAAGNCTFAQYDASSSYYDYDLQSC